MGDVIFEDRKQDWNTSSSSHQKEGGSVMRFFMKTGIVKSQRGANVFMIVVAALLFILSWYMYASSGQNRTQQVYYEDLSPEERTSVPQELLDSLPKRN